MIVSIVGGGGFFTFVQINNILMEILKSSIICSNTCALIIFIELPFVLELKELKMISSINI